MLDIALESIVRQAFPRSRIDSWAGLDGGISSGAVAVTVELEDGTLRKVVVRRPNYDTAAERQRIVRTEHAVLTRCLAHRLPVPRPVLVDLETPAIVLDYLEGAPDFAPRDPHRLCREMAMQLARIHGVPGDEAFQLVRRRQDSAARSVQNTPTALDASLDEARIRAVLNQLWPWPQYNRDVLLHGDFWPGNLLWEDGAIVGVLDWEESEIGDPLADLSVARLDVLWAYGRSAMDAFTRHYRQQTGIDVRNLARWDLCISLRPMSRLEHWASVYAKPPICRPDVTEGTMRAGHRAFVEQALSELRREGTVS